MFKRVFSTNKRQCARRDDDVIARPCAMLPWQRRARAHDVTARMRRDDDVIRRARARLMTSSKMAAPIKHVHARAHGRRHLDDVIAGSANHERDSDDVIAAILDHVTSRGPASTNQERFTFYILQLHF